MQLSLIKADQMLAAFLFIFCKWLFRSEHLSVRPTAYRDSFMGEKVEEDSLEGIMVVRFKLQEDSLEESMVRFKLQKDPSSRMEVMEACMKLLFNQNLALLAEQLQLWQIDSNLLTSALPHLEESALANIVWNLSGQYTFLANSIR